MTNNLPQHAAELAAIANEIPDENLRQKVTAIASGIASIGEAISVEGSEEYEAPHLFADDERIEEMYRNR